MLVMDIKEFPLLGKGKGLKIIQIPPDKLKMREEYMTAIASFSEGDSLLLQSGKRHITLKPDAINDYYGQRGLRGNMLPQGFRQISAITVVREPVKE